MVDHLNPSDRSRNMAAVRGRDTNPELIVRRIVHGLGFRFRLHRKALPGTPDIVLPRLQKIIFVHGCFWHRHPKCHYASIPATRTEFWTEKLCANVERDKKSIHDLRQLGWRVMVVWQCELRDLFALRRRIEKFLKH